VDIPRKVDHLFRSKLIHPNGIQNGGLLVAVFHISGSFWASLELFCRIRKKTFPGSPKKITSGIIDLMATLAEPYCSKNKLRETFQTNCKLVAGIARHHSK
jgi:hypothetical protein